MYTTTFKKYLDAAKHNKEEIIEIIKTKPYLQWKEFFDSSYLNKTLCPDIDFDNELSLVKSAQHICRKYEIEAIPQDFERTNDDINEAINILYNYRSEIETAIHVRRQNCAHLNSEYTWHDSHYDYYQCHDCGHIEKK